MFSSKKSSGIFLSVFECSGTSCLVVLVSFSDRCASLSESSSFPLSMSFDFDLCLSGTLSDRVSDSTLSDLDLFLEGLSLDIDLFLSFL